MNERKSYSEYLREKFPAKPGFVVVPREVGEVCLMVGRVRKVRGVEKVFFE